MGCKNDIPAHALQWRAGLKCFMPEIEEKARSGQVILN
jgi:hypothetical protein